LSLTHPSEDFVTLRLERRNSQLTLDPEHLASAFNMLAVLGLLRDPGTIEVRYPRAAARKRSAPSVFSVKPRNERCTPVIAASAAATRARASSG